MFLLLGQESNEEKLYEVLFLFCFLNPFIIYLFSYLFSYLFWIFETGFFCVDQSDLELRDLSASASLVL